jgi:hypothetical protein
MMKHNTPPAFVSLDGLLQRATAYEQWRTPLHESLRTSMLLSLGSTFSVLLALWLLPFLMPLGDAEVLLLGREWLAASLAWAYERRDLLLSISGGVLLAQVLACALTGALRAARLGGHWLLLVMIGAGVLHGFVLSLALAVLLFNVLFWLLLLFSAIYIAGQLAWALLRASFSR